MVAVRANWKGHLKIGELSCPVALYTGASTAERISFHTLNRKTGNRVRREFVDPSTGKPVEREDQAKGYELDERNIVVLDQEEIDQAVPEAKKLLAVGAFIPCRDIDRLYFDKPYFLAPSGPLAQEAFAVIREAMAQMKVGALAHAVLFRRYRALMIRAQGPGLVAHTLHFDYEVRSVAAAFDEIPKLKLKKEMIDLAGHIIDTKEGSFDPSTFDDRYEAAVAELVKAKLEGRTIKRKKVPEPKKVVDLMEALRASVGEQAKPASRTPRKRSAPLKKAS
jgi:DNA end-binding protein Ku